MHNKERSFKWSTSVLEEWVSLWHFFLWTMYGGWTICDTNIFYLTIFITMNLVLCDAIVICVPRRGVGQFVLFARTDCRHHSSRPRLWMFSHFHSILFDALSQGLLQTYLTRFSDFVSLLCNIFHVASLMFCGVPDFYFVKI